jgi:hypothetical protein
MHAMEERAACALLKARFEAAGFHIQENRVFDEAGIRFEIDGFDPERRVGYEYLTAHSGDGWDVGDDVIAELETRKQHGDLFILVVDEREAPDADTLGERADAFLDELRAREILPDVEPPHDKKGAAKKPVAKAAAPEKPETKKATPKPAKPTAKKPAAKPAKKPAKKKR